MSLSIARSPVSVRPRTDRRRPYAHLCHIYTHLARHTQRRYVSLQTVQRAFWHGLGLVAVLALVSCTPSPHPAQALHVRFPDGQTMTVEFVPLPDGQTQVRCTARWGRTYAANVEVCQRFQAAYERQP